NGMNHSEKNVMAILDIDSLVLAKKKDIHFKNEPGSSRREQRLLGISVAGLMSQSVGGIMAGKWTQSGLSLSIENGETLRFEENAEKTDASQLVIQSVDRFPMIELTYDRVGS